MHFILENNKVQNIQKLWKQNFLTLEECFILGKDWVFFAFLFSRKKIFQTGTF